MRSPECEKFHKYPNVHPLTGYYMPTLSKEYQYFVDKCGEPPNLPFETTYPAHMTSPKRTVKPDDYYPQDEPDVNEFALTATPETSELIQASIQVGRDRYPSFEMYIQAAEHMEILYNGRRRNQYPSYFRDASPFEIFKIYTGEPARSARIFLTELILDQNRNYNFHGEKSEIDHFMEQRGYTNFYMGYLNTQDPSVQAYLGQLPLTPENFAKTITPDQEILMEKFRRKALSPRSVNLEILPASVERGGSIFDEQIDYKEKIQHGGNTHGPTLMPIGFRKNVLMDKIIEINNKLPQLAYNNNIIRDYIKYEGEKDNRGKDIKNKGLSLDKNNRNTYYMMLYNELHIRGVIK
jgi:hypothetical protein